ncbi:hypothetical protein HME9304_02245 [Flagellimonas maritima]|uniref:Uncharacterized protein n=1 Tax=Flagellimonas maritima TaxID=1383885 RepID=A0A2Z4LU14_9FLAO|nr:hypothetical protein HME9304_02245 [Allomuricauda aurantiaca]
MEAIVIHIFIPLADLCEHITSSFKVSYFILIVKPVSNYFE